MAVVLGGLAFGGGCSGHQDRILRQERLRRSLDQHVYSESSAVLLSAMGKVLRRRHWKPLAPASLPTRTGAGQLIRTGKKICRNPPRQLAQLTCVEYISMRRYQLKQGKSRIEVWRHVGNDRRRGWRLELEILEQIDGPRAARLRTGARGGDR